MSKEFNKATLDAMADMETDDVYESADELFGEVLKMRTETDEFYDVYKCWDVSAHVEKLTGNVWINDIEITKQQAAEFARQILEMCGEGDDDN